jgi:hypothetical protein
LHFGNLHLLHHDGFGHDRTRALFFGKAPERQPPGRKYAENEERGE